MKVKIEYEFCSSGTFHHMATASTRTDDGRFICACRVASSWEAAKARAVEDLATKVGLRMEVIPPSEEIEL